MSRPARVLTTLICLLLAAHASAADLSSEVAKIIRSVDLKGGEVSVSIKEVQTAEPLVSIDAGHPRIPASNMKLLTTGAALHVLGPDFEFRTSMRLEGDRLIIVGDGDPGFGDPELLALVRLAGRDGITFDDLITLWVNAVVDADITHLSEVVVDDRVFDRNFLHEDWPRDQLDKRYCAEVAGMNVHLNVLHFFPSPVHGGRPDVSNYVPRAGWIPITNQATSNTGPRESNRVGIARPYQTNTLTVYGNVSSRFRQPVPVTFHNPPEFFAQLLATRLQERGVEVDDFRLARPSEHFDAGMIIGPVVRTPISTALTRCNRDSTNLYAEALLKRSGHAITNGQPGSFANGTAAVRFVINERIDDRGMSSNVVPQDGSGLSRNNRITADLMTEWLCSLARDEELGETFIQSLAIGGASGTLDDRFRSINLNGTIVQAKSGYINGVSCLSGFVTLPDGRRRAFSILANELNVPGTVTRAKRMQEQIVAAIAQDMAATATAVELGG